MHKNAQRARATRTRTNPLFPSHVLALGERVKRIVQLNDRWDLAIELDRRGLGGRDAGRRLLLHRDRNRTRTRQHQESAIVGDKRWPLCALCAHAAHAARPARPLTKFLIAAAHDVCAAHAAGAAALSGQSRLQLRLTLATQSARPRSAQTQRPAAAAAAARGVRRPTHHLRAAARRAPRHDHLQRQAKEVRKVSKRSEQLRRGGEGEETV
jgi:hypothetical protein